MIQKKIREREKQRSKVILGLVIAIILMASTISYVWLEREATGEKGIAYKDYVFFKTEESWQTVLKIKNQEVVLKTFNLPQDVENVSVQGSPILANFFDKTIFIVLNNGTIFEKKAAMQYNIFSRFALRMQLACSRENENSTFCIENNLPVKDCDDSNLQTTVIILKEYEGTAEVNYKNFCLEVKGNKEGLLKANDKALYVIFGIM